METKQIINGLLDRADRVADQSAGRIMRQAAERLPTLRIRNRRITIDLEGASAPSFLLRVQG